MYSLSKGVRLHKVIIITNIKPYFKRLDRQKLKSNRSAIATIDAVEIQNAIAFFDTRERSGVQRILP